MRTVFNHMQESILAEQEKNRKYEKARTDMIAGISHDLRTPLTAMKGTIKGLMGWSCVYTGTAKEISAGGIQADRRYGYALKPTSLSVQNGDREYADFHADHRYWQFS